MEKIEGALRFETVPWYLLRFTKQHIQPGKSLEEWCKRLLQNKEAEHLFFVSEGSDSSNNHYQGVIYTSIHKDTLRNRCRSLITDKKGNDAYSMKKGDPTFDAALRAVLYLCKGDNSKLESGKDPVRDDRVNVRYISSFLDEDDVKFLHEEFWRRNAEMCFVVEKREKKNETFSEYVIKQFRSNNEEFRKKHLVISDVQIIGFIRSFFRDNNKPYLDKVIEGIFNTCQAIRDESVYGSDYIERTDKEFLERLMRSRMRI